MFNNERIKRLEKEIERLHDKTVDLKRDIEVKTSIYIDVLRDGWTLKDEEKLCIVDVIEKMIKTLGYKMTYEYKPEEKTLSFKEIKAKKKTKKQKEAKSTKKRKEQ